jgi:predicted nucleic acid-binding protein
VTRLVIDASALQSGIVGIDPSPRLLGEVRRGLTQPYFLKRIDPADAERAVREIARASIQLRDPRDPVSVVRDPADDYLVALGLTAGARAVVTCSTTPDSTHPRSPSARRANCSSSDQPTC